MNYIELAQKAKAKYPQYQDTDDLELARKIVKKFPDAYGDTTFKNIDDTLKPVIGAQLPEKQGTSVFVDEAALNKAKQEFTLNLDGVEFDNTAVNLHYSELDNLQYSNDQAGLEARMVSDTGFTNVSDAYTALSGVNTLSKVILPSEAAEQALEAGIVEPEDEGFQRKAGFIDTGKALLKSVETLTQALTGSIFDHSQARIEVPGWESMTGTQQAMYQMSLSTMLPPGVSAPIVGGIITEQESEEQFELRNKIKESTKFIPKEWDESIQRVYADVADEEIPFLELGVKVLASQGATIATGLNPLIGLPSMISIERETMLEELTQAGIPYSDAQDWASLYGGLSGSIEYIENSGKLVGSLLKKPKEWTKKKAFQILTSTLKNAGINVLEELSQDELNRLIFNAAANQYNDKNPDAETQIEIREFSTESMAKTAKTSLAMSVVLGSAGYSRQAVKTVQDVRAVKKGKISVLDNLHLPKEVADQAKTDLDKVKTPEEFGVWYDGVVASVGENGIAGNALIPNDKGYSLADLFNAYIANDPKNTKRNVKQAVEQGGDKLDLLINSISKFEENWDGKTPKERIRITDNPYLVQGINELAKVDDTSPVVATIETTVVGLTTPLTQGQFKSLGNSRKDLMVAMSMLDTENSQVLIDAVQGNQKAQGIWNDLTKTRKLQEKLIIEGKESLTDNERTQLLEARKRSITHKVGADSNARAVEEAVADKDPSLDPEKGLGLTTRLMSWTNPLKAIARVAPNFANRLSRYESLRNHYYNSYLSGDTLRQLQSLKKVDNLFRRLMVEDPQVAKIIGITYQTDLAKLYNQDTPLGERTTPQALELLGLLVDMVRDPSTMDTQHQPLVDLLAPHMNKSYVKLLVKELDVLRQNGVVDIRNALSAHFEASKQVGRKNPLLIVPQIKQTSRSTFLRDKFGDDPKNIDAIIQGKRTGGDFTDSAGNQVVISGNDIKYLESPFETILYTVKRAADMKAANEIFDDGAPFDVSFDQNGLPRVTDINTEALRSTEELKGLNDTAFKYITNTVGDILSKPVAGSNFVRNWKRVVTPMVSNISTAVKQFGDLSKMAHQIGQTVGAKGTFKIIKDITLAHATKNNDVMSNWVVDGVNVDISPSSIGADIVDIDLPHETVAKSFREYWKTVSAEQKYAGMIGDTNRERVWNWVKEGWTKNSLVLMKYADVKMKDIYLEGSIRALQQVDESTRVERLTTMLRGDTNLAVNVSDALMNKSLDVDTRTALYNILNRLHPLSAFDRAPAFRALPIFGFFQSFVTHQAGIFQDMTLNPITDAKRYADLSYQYHAQSIALRGKLAKNEVKLADSDSLGEQEALKEIVADLRNKVSAAKAKRKYATDRSLEKTKDASLGVINYIIFYLMLDVGIVHAQRALRKLFGEEEKPWEDDYKTDLLAAYLDTSLPIVNLSVLMDARKQSKPTEALISDVTDMPIPFTRTAKAISQFVKNGEIDDAKQLLKGVPLVGAMLYDGALIIENLD